MAWQDGGVAVVVDLDGVVWLGDAPIPGGAEAVEMLRAAGERVVFLTNNSYPALADHLAKLARMGIECPPEDFATSAQAAASLLAAGSRALVLGGPGIVEALAARGVEVVDAGAGTAGDPDSTAGEVDAVVVGFDRRFDFDRLTRATRCILAGADLVATNDDATYPTPTGLLPGGGSLVAAVAYASGRKATVAGKPYEPVVRLLGDRVGDVGLVIGDRPSTDGGLARRLGARFGLVLTGVTPAGHADVDPAPDLEAATFLELAIRVTGGAAAR
jgi:HAD superfamily hydrolase (TIGR01450 family)